ncbi:MAG: hypothetical protein DDG58_00510 [Ardenticatenia bacterium]|nr:MAG: hypothetical protein DDG58_00510 [Ardenticatenia bacterium]
MRRVLVALFVAMLASIAWTGVAAAQWPFYVCTPSGCHYPYYHAYSGSSYAYGYWTGYYTGYAYGYSKGYYDGSRGYPYSPSYGYYPYAYYPPYPVYPIVFGGHTSPGF